MNIEANVLGKNTFVTIIDMTLLPNDEVDNIPENVMNLTSGNWWLRDAGHTTFDASYINDCNEIDYDFIDSEKNLRPALHISSKENEYLVGKEIEFKGDRYTIISHSYALCNSFVKKSCIFNNDWSAKDCNKYNNSVIKKTIDSIKG